MCRGKTYVKEAYHAIFENDFQKAVAAFKMAISCEPDNASYYYKLSITHSRNGDINEALEAAKKASELLPQNQTYRYHLQILLSKNLVISAAEKMRSGMIEEEIEETLIKAKKLDPLNIEAYLLLGIYYGEKRNLSRGLKEFERALHIDPHLQQAIHLKKYYLSLYQKGD